MLIDILLVKYTPFKEMEKDYIKTLRYLQTQKVNIIVHDNTDNNIGLVAARNKLLKMSTADCVVFMDYDFSFINVDFKDMAEYLFNHKNGIICARDSREKEFSKPAKYFESCYCNFMMMRRETALAMNGFYKRYFTAYADWDMFNRLEQNGYKLLTHNNSVVNHIGHSSLIENKQDIWNKDYDVYYSLWGEKSWRPA